MKSCKTLCQCRGCGSRGHYLGRVYEDKAGVLPGGKPVGITLIHPKSNCYIYSRCCASLLDIVALKWNGHTEKPAPPIDNGFGPYEDAPFSRDPLAGVPSLVSVLGGSEDGAEWLDGPPMRCGPASVRNGRSYEPIYVLSVLSDGRKAYIFSESFHITPTPPTK